MCRVAKLAANVDVVDRLTRLDLRVPAFAGAADRPYPHG